MNYLVEKSPWVQTKGDRGINLTRKEPYRSGPLRRIETRSVCDLYPWASSRLLVQLRGLSLRKWDAAVRSHQKKFAWSFTKNRASVTDFLRVRSGCGSQCFHSVNPTICWWTASYRHSTPEHTHYPTPYRGTAEAPLLDSSCVINLRSILSPVIMLMSNLMPLSDS